MTTAPGIGIDHGIVFFVVSDDQAHMTAGSLGRDFLLLELTKLHAPDHRDPLVNIFPDHVLKFFIFHLTGCPKLQFHLRLHFRKGFRHHIIGSITFFLYHNGNLPFFHLSGNFVVIADNFFQILDTISAQIKRRDFHAEFSTDLLDNFHHTFYGCTLIRPTSRHLSKRMLRHIFIAVITQDPFQNRRHTITFHALIDHRDIVKPDIAVLRALEIFRQFNPPYGCMRV